MKTEIFRTNSRAGTLAWALAFLLLYHAVYASYLNPIFEYFHYFYHPRPAALYIYTYLLALLPLAFHAHRATPASVGAAIIYVMCFAPGMLTMLFMWEQAIGALVASLALLSFGMCGLILVGNGPGTASPNTALESPSTLPLHPTVRSTIFALTVISAVAILASNWSHMSLVGFADVYDLRAQSRDAASGALVGYLTLWLSLVFIPYYSAAGALEKNRPKFYFSVALSLLIYTSSGAKSTLLMPFTILLFVWLARSGKDFLPQLLKMFSVVLLTMVIEIPELDVIKSLVIMRTLSTGGWTLAKYYEFFTQNGLTYYSHVGVVNALTGAYPYGEYSMGQVIGIEYINSAEANFNANFWASDGFAALGVAGLIPASAAAIFSLYLVNRFAREHDSRFVAFWLTGFWTALLNSPVPTSLLSGGGFIIMAFLYISSRLSRRPPIPSPAPGLNNTPSVLPS